MFWVFVPFLVIGILELMFHFGIARFFRGLTFFSGRCFGFVLGGFIDGLLGRRRHD